MTGYERILNVLTNKVVDQTPIMLHNFMPATREKNYTMGDFRNSPKVIARTFIDYSRKYDLDGILIDIDTCMESCAIGVPTDFPEDAPARNHGSIKGGIDACIEAMDSEKIKKDDRIKVMIESVHLIKREVGGELFVRANADQGPFSLAMLSYGMTEFMMALMDESLKEKLKILMDRAFDVHLTYHRLLNEAGADMTSFGDSSCGPDLISADMYKEYAMPYHIRLAKTLKEEGILNLCHICGNQDRIITDLAEVGFSALEVDYKTNLVRAKKIVENKTAFFGPIDPSGIFYFGTPEQVTNETNKVLEIFGGENIVIGAGCALPPGVSEVNVRAFVKAVKSYSLS